jgi:ferredoxin
MIYFIILFGTNKWRRNMIANYGYKDGSGDFFISIDTDKCDGCGDCVTACPYGVFVTGEDENDPFREEPVAMVIAEHRKKIKYSCAPCKPSTGERNLPCVSACKPDAIAHSW